MRDKIRKKILRYIYPDLLIPIKSTIISGVFLIVAFDLLIRVGYSDLIVLPTVFLYCIYIFFFKPKSMITFMFCLGILALMSFEYIMSGPTVRAEKASVWLFLFLAIGISQQWKELKK